VGGNAIDVIRKKRTSSHRRALALVYSTRTAIARPKPAHDRLLAQSKLMARGQECQASLLRIHELQYCVQYAFHSFQSGGRGMGGWNE
jgi:hypothetical protein